MHAYAEALDRLREALRWFVAVPELLLLHVTTSAELRVPALEEIQRAQLRRENTAAIFISTTPAEDSAADWTARTEELAEVFAVFAEEAARAERPVAFGSPRRSGGSGYAGFIAALAEYASALGQAFPHLILALAPEGITQAEAWQQDLRSLLNERSLKQVRFIVVEPEPAPALALAVELGGLGERLDIRTDPQAPQRRLKTMVAGMRSAPPGADGYRMAGMAGPKEAPPPRRRTGGMPAAVIAEELARAGANPALANAEALQTLRVQAMSASLAMSEGRPAEAVQFQLEARDAAEQAGLNNEATLMELMLGGYLLQGGGLAQALTVFERTVTRTQQLNQPDLEAQAHMAKGGALLASQRPFDAAGAYTQGAHVAEAAGNGSVAIECYRMVGQLLLQNGQPKEAATAFNRALTVASGVAPAERVSSSAPEAATALATLYREHGMPAQADSLEAQVAAWNAAAIAAAEHAGESAQGLNASGGEST